MVADFLMAILGTLSAIAYVRARHAGDAFRFDVLVVFAVADLVVAALLHPSASSCIVLACVTTCAVTDMSCGYIYDVVTFPSLIALLGIALLEGTFASAVGWALTAPAGCLILYAATRRRGLGLGDVKLFTVVAAGLRSSVGDVFGGSFVIGACFVVFAIVRRRLSLGETVPFAPFIALATIVDFPCRWLLK